MDRYNKYQIKQCTHTLTHCTHNIWWLVLGWVTTKEDHPRLARYQVLLTYLLTCLRASVYYGAFYKCDYYYYYYY